MIIQYQRSVFVALWLLLLVTLEQVASFTSFATNRIEHSSRTSILKHQYVVVHDHPLSLPITRFAKVQYEPSIRSTTQLSMLSIKNVIATVLHHDPDDHHVMMAGSIWPILQKLFTAPMKFRLILHNIVSITEWQECILLPMLAFGITPLAKLYYRASCPKDRPMEEMKRFGIVAFLDQISKVALSVYVMDVISITLTTIGFTFAKQWRIAEVYAKFACTCCPKMAVLCMHLLMYNVISMSFLFLLPIQTLFMPCNDSYCTRS